MSVFLIILLSLVVGLALGFYAGRLTIREMRADYDRRIEDLRRITTRQLEEQRSAGEKQAELLAERLKNEAERQMQERSSQLHRENARQLDGILEPLRHGIREMRETVERADRQHHDTMARLDESIKATLSQARIVGQRADRLADALTGNNKTQGDFGELRLRTLLESMGLEEGIQFEEQQTLRDSQGRTVADADTAQKLRPDVILHFPDRRDVIIDAKVSLTAYRDYYEADDDARRQAALKRHVDSVRRHVDELSRKNYAGQIDAKGTRPDFVVMYLFSDSALSLALTAAPDLWKYAYDKGVFVTASQNLYALLRMLELAWTQQRQVENQQSIIDQANTVVSRVQLFYQRFLNVEDCLRKTQKAFDDVRTVISPNGQSIVAAANRLVRLGAREDARKSRPSLPKADDETAAPVSESLCSADVTAAAPPTIDTPDGDKRATQSPSHQPHSVPPDSAHLQ